MKKIEIWRALFLMALGTLILGLQACSKDADELEIPQDARLSQAEFRAVMEADQRTGSADATLAEIYLAGNGMFGKTAFDGCYEAAYTDTGFTATFNNCLLNGTDNVNGTLVVVYHAGTETAGFTATYDGFYVGDVVLNGTRAFTLSAGAAQNSIGFEVVSEMNAGLADGTQITESGRKTVAITLGASLQDSTFTIEGSWNLTIGDTAYAADVTSPLTGNFACPHLVGGTMDLSKNGLKIAVDFGDGTCDGSVLITYPNGAREELEL